MLWVATNQFPVQFTTREWFFVSLLYIKIFIFVVLWKDFYLLNLSICVLRISKNGTKVHIFSRLWWTLLPVIQVNIVHVAHRKKLLKLVKCWLLSKKMFFLLFKWSRIVRFLSKYFVGFSCNWIHDCMQLEKKTMFLNTIHIIY